MDAATFRPEPEKGEGHGWCGGALRWPAGHQGDATACAGGAGTGKGKDGRPIRGAGGRSGRHPGLLPEDTQH